MYVPVKGTRLVRFDPSNPRRFLPSHTLTPALHHTYSRMHCTASYMLTPALQRTPILTPALHCRHTYTSRLHCTGMFQVRMHTKAGACSSTDMCLIVHRLLRCSSMFIRRNVFGHAQALEMQQHPWKRVCMCYVCLGRAEALEMQQHPWKRVCMCSSKV